ncbi:MAG: alanine:cation symporter family protein [Endomicrobium sp.]|nr:alanine:cation symporter family protein [Endomicrobium sp.]
MEKVCAFVDWLNSYLRGHSMLIFLLGTHLYLTFKTRFIQKKIFLGIKLSAKHGKECGGDISSFGSLAIAMAATVGAGNINRVKTKKGTMLGGAMYALERGLNLKF